MNMHWIDWGIVAALLAFMTFIVLGTKQYMRGVADFLAAGRCAGRYLLCISEGIAGLGAITLLAFWEMYYKGGFTSVWWSLPNWPLLFLLALSGWVIYRFRQTRAMTMAQFFEMRYSRRFRIFAGFMAFASGTINFGIFPSVGAHFFIQFCGLPETFPVLGWSISTFPFMMIFLLSISLFFTFTGGQIAVILTDFVQGIFCTIVLIAVCFVLLSQVNWGHISEALAMAPENQSFVNPLKIGDIEGFNIWFFLIQYFLWFYCWKAWQGAQAYNCSAKSPHEARMAQIIGTWRYFAQEMIIPIIAICAIAFLLHPDFAAQAAGVKEALSGFANDKLQAQAAVPLALTQLLPVGVMGCLTAVMLAALISTDDTYLHSWGSIFIQDVVMPLRKKPLTPKQHMFLLRCSIGGVAAFIFCFSMVFTLTEHIRMFFAITGAIYLGGAGSCIIGGLYWRRGTTEAAWSAMITGAVLAVAGVVVRQIDPDFPLDGQHMSFFAAMAAITVYVVVSLLTGRKKFNLDRMLHRGPYGIQEDAVEGDTDVAAHWRWLGINKEFTRWDKRIYIGSVVWILLWGLVFLVGTAWGLFGDIPDESWTAFWYFMVCMGLSLILVTTTWLLIGGLRDVKDMFSRLRTMARDDMDDGTVRPGEKEERSA